MRLHLHWAMPSLASVVSGQCEDGRLPKDLFMRWASEQFDAVHGEEAEAEQSAEYDGRHISSIRWWSGLEMCTSLGLHECETKRLLLTGLPREDQLRCLTSEYHGLCHDRVKSFLEECCDADLVRSFLYNFRHIGGEDGEWQEFGGMREGVCLIFGALEKSDEMVEALIDFFAADKQRHCFLLGVDCLTGNTLLHCAVGAKNKKWMQICIQVGISPRYVNLAGKTAAQMTDDAKIIKFLDIIIRAKAAQDELISEADD